MVDNSPVLLSIIAVVAIVGVVGIVGTIGLIGMKTASSATTPTGLTTFQFGCYQTTPAATLVNISKLPIGFKGNQTVAAKRHAGWQKMPDTACSNRITSTGKSAWQALPQENVFIPLLNNQCFVVDVFANPEDKVNLIVPKQPCPTAPPPGGTSFSDNFNDNNIDDWLNPTEMATEFCVPGSSLTTIFGSTAACTSFVTSFPSLFPSNGKVCSGSVGTTIGASPPKFNLPSSLAIQSDVDFVNGASGIWPAFFDFFNFQGYFVNMDVFQPVEGAPLELFIYVAAQQGFDIISDESTVISGLQGPTVKIGQVFTPNTVSATVNDQIVLTIPRIFEVSNGRGITQINNYCFDNVLFSTP